jgi:PAS domain S-box-containing protein
MEAAPGLTPTRRDEQRSLGRRILSRLPRRSTQGERAMSLGFAGALFAAFFALALAIEDPREAVGVLYTLPIALVAIKFGVIGGVTAAACGLALFSLTNVFTDEQITALGYVTRGAAFIALGAVIGNMSTRLRAAHEIVARREQQLQEILDNSTAVISLKDRDGKYMLVNKKFEELFHIGRTEVVGKTDRDLFPAYTADALKANDRRVLKEGRALEIEEEAPHDDGTHTYISVKFPLYDAGGKAYGVCGISTDITGRKAAERTLRESKDYIGQIIDGAREAFISIDQNGVVRAWNRAAEEMFGWPATKAIGKELAELIIPERYRAAHRRGLERFRQTGKGPMLGKRVELLALHRDGSEFPVEISITAVRVRGGFSFHAFIHDITDRKRLEREVVRLSELRAGVLDE